LGPVAAQYITAANVPLRLERESSISVYARRVAHAKTSWKPQRQGKRGGWSACSPRLNTYPLARLNQLSLAEQPPAAPESRFPRCPAGSGQASAVRRSSRTMSKQAPGGAPLASRATNAEGIVAPSGGETVVRGFGGLRERVTGAFLGCRNRFLRHLVKDIFDEHELTSAVANWLSKDIPEDIVWR
jgi:hypothetical protein